MGKFVALINSCGVKFDVWQDEKKGRLFTSLSGGGPLKTLPEKLDGQLHEVTESSFMFLWKTSLDVLTHFETDVLGTCVEQKTRAFLSTFVELGKTKCKGYGKDRVTPYIHIFAHHASAKH
ncbi:unnamed protein product [Ixodes hexagonus]